MDMLFLMEKNGRLKVRKFKENGVFAIAQSNDGKMWIGTGNGIYINE